MIDRWRERRTLAIVGPAAAAYVRVHGRRVKDGPLAELEYPPGQEHSSQYLVSKLVGTYERELHGVLGRWIADGVDLLVNVGCAEGFYAVGLARAIPRASVIAFDSNPDERARCLAMATLNGVADRVEVRGLCTPEELAKLPRANTALLCDCEGAEKLVLDPARVPSMAGWRILVELHDFIDPTISATVLPRFAASHEIEFIDSRNPQLDIPSELAFMTEREQRKTLAERPVAMRWACLRPLRATGQTVDPPLVAHERSHSSFS
jgi:hypothetical protein